MNRKALAAAGVSVCTATLLILPLAPAYASVAAVSPDSQSIRSGGTASWGLAWSNGSGHHYNVTFTYGDGTKWTATNTTATSTGLSHGFVTCTGQTFNQKLTVFDSTTGSTATATAVTKVSKGGAC